MPAIKVISLIVATTCLSPLQGYGAVTADFVGSASRLYFTRADHRIVQYEHSNGSLTAFRAGAFERGAMSYRELAFDSGNNLYAANYGAGDFGIVKFSQDGSTISNFLSKDKNDAYWGLTFGPDGFLYTTLSSSNLIRKIDSNGVVISDFTDPKLNSPCGLAFDTNGNLLVAN